MNQPPKQAPETAIWRNGCIIAALLLCCFPIGLYLIWTHPNWSTAVKAIWTGIWLAIAIPAMVNVQREEQAAKQELVEAHQLWKSGQKAEATAKYKRLMAESGYVLGSERSIVLSHVIDYEATEGDVSRAKRMIADALEWGDSLYLESKQAKALLDEARVERERLKRAETFAQAEEDRRTTNNSGQASEDRTAIPRSSEPAVRTNDGDESRYNEEATERRTAKTYTARGGWRDTPVTIELSDFASRLVTLDDVKRVKDEITATATLSPNAPRSDIYIYALNWTGFDKSGARVDDGLVRNGDLEPGQRTRISIIMVGRKEITRIELQYNPMR